MEPLKPITRQLRAVAALGGVVCLLAWAALAVRGAEVYKPNPHDVLAGFLHRFPEHVQWPNRPATTNPAPWRIGILGDDPFGEALILVTRTNPVAGRDFEIVHATRAEDLRTCEVVYIGLKDEEKIKAALAALAGRPILTVGETENFLKLGGVIRMELRKYAQFSVNLDAAKASDLKIKAKMLEVARQIIKDGKLNKSL